MSSLPEFKLPDSAKEASGNAPNTMVAKAYQALTPWFASCVPLKEKGAQDLLAAANPKLTARVVEGRLVSWAAKVNFLAKDMDKLNDALGGKLADDTEDPDEEENKDGKTA